MKSNNLICLYKPKLTEAEILFIWKFNVIYYINLLSDRSDFIKDSTNLILEKFDCVQFRYEVIDEIGKGAFGCVYKVYDHKE